MTQTVSPRVSKVLATHNARYYELRIDPQELADIIQHKLMKGNCDAMMQTMRHDDTDYCQILQMMRLKAAAAKRNGRAYLSLALRDEHMETFWQGTFIPPSLDSFDGFIDQWEKRGFEVIGYRIY